MNCYKLILDGYDKIGGMLYAPDCYPTPLARDAECVNGWEDLILELRDGKYTPYMECVSGANLVDEEFKNLLNSFITEKECIEFLPVMVQSKEYGQKQYYIMHFTIIHDVINKKETVYIQETGSIVKAVLDKSKVDGLHVFNTMPYVNDVYVSEKVYKAIIAKNLGTGIEFLKRRCL